MRITKILRLLALAGSVLSLIPLHARASSHREAPLITTMPKTDGTDFYMFNSYEPGRGGFVTIVADFNPCRIRFLARITTRWILKRFTTLISTTTVMRCLRSLLDFTSPIRTRG